MQMEKKNSGYTISLTSRYYILDKLDKKSVSI